MRHRPDHRILNYERPKDKVYGGQRYSMSRNPILHDQEFCAKAFPLVGVKYRGKKKGG